MDQDRNWLQVVAGAAGKKMKKTLGCQEATKRTGKEAAACRWVIMTTRMEVSFNFFCKDTFVP